MLGASTGPGGQVLGAAAGGSCSAPFMWFMMNGFGPTPPASQVSAFQQFMNTYQNAGLAVTGVYDAATVAAVRNFQNANKPPVLDPWPTDSTGHFYLTTRRWANMEFCRLQGVNLNIPMPDLFPWQGPH